MEKTQRDWKGSEIDEVLKFARKTTEEPSHCIF